MKTFGFLVVGLLVGAVAVYFYLQPRYQYKARYVVELNNALGNDKDAGSFQAFLKAVNIQKWSSDITLVTPDKTTVIPAVPPPSPIPSTGTNTPDVLNIHLGDQMNPNTMHVTQRVALYRIQDLDALLKTLAPTP